MSGKQFIQGWRIIKGWAKTRDTEEGDKEDWRVIREVSEPRSG